MQKKHSSRERDGKEQMVDGRAARVQRTGGSRMHRHVGKKHAGCRQSREKSGKTPPVESNPEDLDSWTKYSFIFTVILGSEEQSRDRAMKDIFHYQKMEEYPRSIV